MKNAASAVPELEREREPSNDAYISHTAIENVSYKHLKAERLTR